MGTARESQQPVEIPEAKRTKEGPRKTYCYRVVVGIKEDIWLCLLETMGIVREIYHGEFDPGSERTLAARLKHASRAARSSNRS